MTNPPSVPSLDVEACVRLLKDYQRILKEKLHKCSIRSVCHTPFPCSTCRGICGDIDQVGALASALPGMGQDSERLDWLNGRLNWFTTQGPGHDPQYRDIRERIDAAQTMTPEYVAARAAQPEETSADASQDCYACGHDRAQHLNESDELDDCLDCHCSEFMQSPAPSPERPE